MPASYCRVDAENGDGIDDPSEDALSIMIGDLNHTDNTFVVIQPDTEDPVWFASVSLLDEGGFEVELRDMRHREHQLIVQHEASRIARDVTTWLAARSKERPAYQLAVNQALKHLAGTRYGAEDYELALFGLAVLCGEAPDEAIGQVVIAARAMDSALRRAGIEGLGIFGPDAAAHAPVIAAALSDPDPDVREAGHTSLKLVLRRKEPDEELREAVHRAVEQQRLGDRDAP